MILAIVGIAGFMSMLDSTIVIIALPSIQVDLKTTREDLQWVMDAYILMFGGLQLLGGRMADLLGRRQVFLTGLIVFTGASLSSGLASGSVALIISRLIQGAGAALLTPGAQSIVVTIFRHPRERRVALSIWSGLSAFGGTLGVVGGGLLVNYLDWRWVFLVNLPVGTAVAVATLLIIPALRPTATELRRSFDTLGAATATGGLLLLVYGLIGASERRWSSASDFWPFVAAAALFAAFAVVERCSADPLVPLGLLTKGPLTASAIGLMFTWAGQISIFFMTSVYLQQVLGASPLQTGLYLLGMGLPALLVVVILPTWIGDASPTRLYSFGAGLFLLGTLLLSRLDVHSSFIADMLPGLMLIGLAMPLCFTSLLIMGISDVSSADSGLASGVLRTISQAGSALGIATVVTFALVRAKELTDAHRPEVQAIVAGLQLGFAMTVGIAATSLLFSFGLIIWKAHLT